VSRVNGQLASSLYVLEAMNVFRKKFVNPLFVVASDDIQ
jgi:hypothetical protein